MWGWKEPLYLQKFNKLKKNEVLKKMKKIRIEAKTCQTDRSGGSSSWTTRIVEFNGEIIGSQYVEHDYAHYTRRTLYATEKKEYVVYEEEVSRMQGETSEDKIFVFSTIEKLQNEFAELANSSAITEKVEIL